MLSNILKSAIVAAIAVASLNAQSFNAQAEKDRKALVKYFEDKFKDPKKNEATFFPYSTENELTNTLRKGVKHDEFAKGSYAFNKVGLQTYNEMKEMPPYENAIDKGAQIYEASAALKKCFPDVTIGGDYPLFDKKRKEVVTLTQAINECIVADGGKKLNEMAGEMAEIEAFFASKTSEADKKVNIKINSKDAAAAYERGKQYYYSQRGYLKLSCAECHVQGAGQRVRNEYMSPLLGHTTHFPVYRLEWEELGTLEKRFEGCIKDQGQNPPKATSKEMKELIYFSAYMSNGMPVDGPDVRK